MTILKCLLSTYQPIGSFILLLIVIVMVAGCSLTKKITSTITDPIQAQIQGDPIKVNLASGPEMTLTAQDFTKSSMVGNATDSGKVGTMGKLPDENDQSNNTTINNDASSDPISAPAVIPGTGPTETPRPAYLTTARPGHAVTVSGLVGQVNGRPIFVDEVLSPIADQLAILGTQESYENFYKDALRLIKQQLRTVVENELLLAEAERTLDSNQRIGLINFIDEMRKDTIRKSGGTETQAERQLREKQGVTLQEHMDQLRKQILIREQVRNEIAGKIVVSWHDIERYYRTHPKEFNPPASIQLRIIAVKDSDIKKKEQVLAALDAGQPFELIAPEYSDLMASASGLMSPVKIPNGIENAKVTVWPSVNEAIRTMHEGDIAGPFTVPSYFVWVRVEHYEDGQPISLYDAQKDIEIKLKDRDYQEEIANYFQKLLDRGNYDDFDLMSENLLSVALDRWSPPHDQ